MILLGNFMLNFFIVQYCFLGNLPSGENYEKSFMHRDVVTHVMVTPTDFIITASQDGHIKFWKKLEVRLH
jgi:peptidylprolyl isomerase domain and WD repeat-containing protein 1